MNKCIWFELVSPRISNWVELIKKINLNININNKAQQTNEFLKFKTTGLQ